MIAYHEVRDEAKVAELAERMDRDGWVGAPLVIVDGESLVTGSHRYAAAQTLGWADDAIPTVELADLFDAADLDFASLHAEYGFPLVDDAMFVELVNELPAVIRAEYGIDIH